MHRGAAEIRAELGIAAGKIGDLQVHVHRMRCPGQKDRRRARFVIAVDLRQHGLLARFHQLPIAQAELVIGDHLGDGLVRRRARLDAIDLALEGILVGVEIGEILDAQILGRIGHRQGKLRAGQVRGQLLGLARGVDVVAELLLRRHPVAQEHIGFALFQRLVADRHRKGLDVGGIAEPGQNGLGDAVGGGDVGPARIGQADGAATRRVIRQRGQGQSGGQAGGKRGDSKAAVAGPEARGHGVLLSG